MGKDNIFAAIRITISAYGLAAAFLLSTTIVIIISLSACIPEIQNISEAQTLPELEFPLSEASIVNALQEAGLPWTVGETIFPGGFIQQDERILNFTLYKDTSTIGFLSSATKDGERSVSIAFLSYFGDSPTMDVYNPPRDEWENIIVLFTLLFGGFESTHQAFRYFSNEVDTLTRYPMEPRPVFPGRIEEVAVWDRVVNDTYFRITIVSPLGRPDEYFRSISVFSDRDIFGPIEYAETDDVS